jgi:hypothetical protein
MTVIKKLSKGISMKKKILGIIVLVMFSVTSIAFAGGDKNRGDKGKGTVVRTQTTGNGK